MVHAAADRARARRRRDAVSRLIQVRVGSAPERVSVKGRPRRGGLNQEDGRILIACADLR